MERGAHKSNSPHGTMRQLFFPRPVFFGGDSHLAGRPPGGWNRNELWFPKRRRRAFNSGRNPSTRMNFFSATPGRTHHASRERDREDVIGYVAAIGPRAIADRVLPRIGGRVA